MREDGTMQMGGAGAAAAGTKYRGFSIFPRSLMSIQTGLELQTA